MVDLHEPIVAALVSSLPAYRGAAEDEGRYGIEAVRLGVVEAAGYFVATARTGEAAGGRSLFFNLGRGHLRAGRDLPSLLSSYAVGAQLVVGQLRERAKADRLDADAVLALHDAIVAYANRLAGQAATGWLYEHDRSPDTSTARRRLISMLLGRLPGSPHDLDDLAGRCNWMSPPTLRAVVAPASGQAQLFSIAPSGSLLGVVDEHVALFIDASESLPTARPAGLRAAIGPEVARAEARLSFERASSTLALEYPGVVLSDEVSVELLMAASPAIRDDLVRALDPLLQLPDRRRRVLLATLERWLAHQGQLTAVARALDAHPQTIRHRLRALDALLGDAMAPHRRIELHLAVRASRAPLSGNDAS